MRVNHIGRRKAILRPGSMESLTRQTTRVADEVQELGRATLASAGEAATQLRSKARGAFESGMKRARKTKDQVDHLVAENPTTSVLVALGVGAVLGFALRRRS